MKSTQATLAGAVMAVVLSTTAFASSAGSIPVTSQAAQAAIVPLLQASQAGSNNDALLLLLDQFTALRAEMETLRGMVEEQGFIISRLQQDSQARYTDLDSRISALYQELDAVAPAGAAAIPTPPAATGAVAQQPSAPTVSSVPGTTAPAATAGSDINNPATQAPAAVTPSVPASGLASGSTPPVMLTEQQLYEVALDTLLQKQQYEESVQQFNQYLAQYPNGRFVTNAYYWQGQAYVNLSRFDEARQAFETVLTKYPDGRKIEDAMYSLGTVYHRLGENSRARAILQDVLTRFPNTSAANLADIYLRTIN
ncbi:MAG TPA: tol-pal system protein YbgF [Pseudohongiella sp.]|nr:tol-pal system protein YbgF [Pseudohongiella sp.]